MDYSAPNIIGLVGVIIIGISYLLLQISYLKIEGLIYSAVNAVGSLMVLYSLYYYWNLPAVLIEVFWFGISVYGVIKVWMRRKKIQLR